jgi:homocysteine S-methyltransferase
MTCRDRNINATKALLLGLNIEGVNNVLVVTGDPIPSAQRDEIKGMFSFNSAILANYITNLNDTTFSSPFNICGALNLNVRNFNNQLAHAKKKIENGVTMFLTQPILTEQALENLKTKT